MMKLFPRPTRLSTDERLLRRHELEIGFIQCYSTI